MSELSFGIYEQIINQIIYNRLSELDMECFDTDSIDAAEGAGVCGGRRTC